MTLNRFARLGLVLLVALPIAAQAQEEESPSRPDRNPLRAHAKGPREPALPGGAPTVAWTDAEVTRAKAHCAKILAGLALDYEPLPPIKEGKCGAPAPILLKAVGSDPKVEIDPLATVTCAVAAGLSAWLSKTVQREARAALGAPVARLSNASSYVCRNRYNGSNTPLSEHALANALDVSEFVFQSGEKVTVLASWPRLVTVPPLPLPKPTRVDAEITGSIATATDARPKAVNAVDVARSRPIDAKTNPFVLPTAAAKAAGPKPPAEATPPDMRSKSDRNGEFVAKVHRGACNTFGTVLGPESNGAHKDHFHFDMKARSHKTICE